MSGKAVRWAWKQKVSPIKKLILVALADYATKGVNLAWPTKKALSEKTGLPERTVQKVVHFLAAQNLISIDYRYDLSGRNTSSKYYILIGGRETHRLLPKETQDLLPRETQDLPRETQDLPQGDTGSPSYRYKVLKDQSEGSLGSGSIGTESSNSQASQKPEQEEEKFTPQDLFDGWNEICGQAGLPRVRELTRSRKSKAIQRLKEHSEQDWWDTAMQRVAESSFCCGHVPGKNGQKPWVASFDWLIHNDINAVKAFEGRYSDGPKKAYNFR